MAVAAFQLCSSLFSSATEAHVHRRLSGYHGGRYLNAPASTPYSASFLPSDCRTTILWSRAANAETTGNSGFTRRLIRLPRKEPMCEPIRERWNGNPGYPSQGVWAELQNKETRTLELDEGHSNEGTPIPCICRCQLCGRRSLFAALGGGFAASKAQKAAGSSDVQMKDYNKLIETVHPSRGTWYEKLFARVMGSCMDSYEAGVADYKRELFEQLDDNVEQVLELGVGTGPNLKYYGKRGRVQKVIGIDPNLQMAKFCSSAALKAGLSESQFEFIHGVGEIVPLPDASVDAVVCTLVLCSVSNVSSTLKEVKRVLKPGGSFLFVEHVAAPEGKSLLLWQRILDPVQQLFADGCHLTRDTLKDIQSAQFKTVEANKFTLPGLFVLGPHIAGVARTGSVVEQSYVS